MDLYEALKSGTSAEELLADFRKDLDAANKRIEQEKKESETKREEIIKVYREDLVLALYNYMEVIFDKDLSDTLTIKDLETSVLAFEKELKAVRDIAKFAKFTPKLSKPDSVKIVASAKDDDVINAFIKSLK